MKLKYFIIPTLIIGFYFTQSCKEDDEIVPNCQVEFTYDPTPYDLEKPCGVPEMDIPTDNPMTMKGVQLGRMLFYDPILSGDSTQACASCHAQEFAFSDNGLQFSLGIDNLAGNRNAMAAINLGYAVDFFWDGRVISMEDQALGPVENPIEMHNTWANAVKSLQKNPDYPRLFGEAFNTSTITKELTVKAIAQFERTLLSYNSKYDRVYCGTEFYTDDAVIRGFEIFTTEEGDCFHCHGTIHFTDHSIRNNGLDSVFTDLGLAEVTGNATDEGMFKIPTLRNLAWSAPYMHDGRFQTLDEVIDFYSEGMRNSATLDPLLRTKHVADRKSVV